MSVDGWDEQVGKLRMKAKYPSGLQLCAASTILILSGFTQRRAPGGGVTPNLHHQGSVCSLLPVNDKAVSTGLCDNFQVKLVRTLC